MGYSGLCSLDIRRMEPCLRQETRLVGRSGRSSYWRGQCLHFTRPFAKKHDLAISPVAGDGHVGFYASMRF